MRRPISPRFGYTKEELRRGKGGFVASRRVVKRGASWGQFVWRPVSWEGGVGRVQTIRVICLSALWSRSDVFWEGLDGQDFPRESGRVLLHCVGRLVCCPAERGTKAHGSEYRPRSKNRKKEWQLRLKRGPPRRGRRREKRKRNALVTVEQLDHKRLSPVTTD